MSGGFAVQGTIRCGHTLGGVDGVDLDQAILAHRCPKLKTLNRKFVEILKRVIPYILDAGADDELLGKMSVFYWLNYLKKRLDDRQYLEEAKRTAREAVKFFLEMRTAS